MATIAYADASPRPSYYSSRAAGNFPDPSFRSMTPIRNRSKETNRPSYPMSALYIKYVRRVWKRVSRATRKPERASVLPDGFVLINNARLNAAKTTKRRSVMFS
ncbi:hypothetical protein ACEPAF_6499 [Sanghuangporus sanghuang]